MDGKIFSALSAISAEIGAISKNKRSEQGNTKYMYRGIDDVLNALSPVLSKHGVVIVPEVLEQIREERQTKSGANLIYSVAKVKYTFYANDGSFVSATVIGEGMDSGDKASNKAMSAAYKYVCFQTFCIATEEMIDSERDSYEVQPQNPNVESFAQRVTALAQQHNLSMEHKIYGSTLKALIEGAGRLTDGQMANIIKTLEALPA